MKTFALALVTALALSGCAATPEQWARMSPSEKQYYMYHRNQQQQAWQNAARNYNAQQQRNSPSTTTCRNFMGTVTCNHN